MAHLVRLAATAANNQQEVTELALVPPLEVTELETVEPQPEVTELETVHRTDQARAAQATRSSTCQ